MKDVHGQSRAVRFPLVKVVAAILFVVVIFLFLMPAGVSYGLPPQEVEGITYYVDCAAGADSNNGTSTGTAWKSLNKANSANLVPGDKLLFKRGCIWYGTLSATWNGNAAAYITIGAYGSGNLPKFQNGATDLADDYYNSVQIMGSYLIVEYLEATITDPPVSGCQANPIGFFVGFNFRNPNNNGSSGSNNILRYSKASKLMAGAHTNTNTHHNKILYNTFVDNHVMDILTPVNVHPTDDIGAWGVLLRGNYHEVGYNYFEDNNSWCTYDTPPQGNSIELYEAKFNSIHHNTAINDRDFSELGGSGSIKSDTNVFAYNLVISNVPDAHFIIARGSGTNWGPTWRTKLYNNTVVLTGSQSEAVICGAGCNSNIMTMRNNIIWAEQKAAFADGAFAESNNIYWDSEGDPFVQFIGFSMNSTSEIANPQFVNLSQRNVRLMSGSPAINAGSLEAVGLGYITDLDDNAVPQSLAADMGGYEYSGTTPPPTSTPPATSTPPPTATPPAGQVHVQDSFSRSLSDSWGSAGTGGAYIYGGGTNANQAFDVNGSAGTILMSSPNIGRDAILQNVNIVNADITFRVQTDKISDRGSQEVVFLARYQNSNTMYRGRIRMFGNGEVFVQAVRGVDGSWLNLGSNTQVQGLTHTPNTFFWVRAQVTGTNPTTIRIKAWANGQSEPSGWNYTVTDSSSALQTSGAVGLRVWLGSATNAPVRFTFDDFLVKNP
jgi:hypothetical protein